MPVYATRQDVLDLYKSDVVITAVDETGNNILDTNRLDTLLAQASKDIEGYVERALGKDAIPATAGDAPSWWNLATIDIALYLASPEGTKARGEKKIRADYWRGLLMKEYPLVNKDGEPVTTTTGGVKFKDATREFTSEKLSGL